MPLPVAVFIYGGRGHGSGASDLRYNLSYVVSNALDNKMPLVAVSFNYRSSIWGFIGGREVRGTGNTNIGLRDQRLALHWVQENIAAFGGDRHKVTIWGASSGADDVGSHLTAYGGRDDGLFRAAIMQSGSAVVRTEYRHATAQSAYDKLAASLCPNAEDSLECLRGLPFAKLNATFDDGSSSASVDTLPLAFPSVDGDFMRTYGSLALKQSAFVKVPIMIGTVSNEGRSWISPDIQKIGHLGKYLQGKVL